MVPEHRSFVGAGDEVYPVNGLTRARPVDSGLHGEVLLPHASSRMQVFGKPGVGGEEYLPQDRNPTSSVEANISPSHPDPVLRYYIGRYLNLVANACSRSSARLKVQLAMNNNDEPDDLRSSLNRIVNRDIEIDGALKCPNAFGSPSLRSR